MISTQTLQTPIFTAVVPSDHTELSRLLSAAVVNHQFKNLLLDDPESALEKGYLGESFLLADDVRALLVSIRADTLTDLARQLSSVLVRSTYPVRSTYSVSAHVQ
ncbi:MAG: hypothetical protein KJ606_09055 [Chloroflexi bacterium]|nr:hypothetical protein [Chloroflexota bacterium]